MSTASNPRGRLLGIAVVPAFVLAHGTADRATAGPPDFTVIVGIPGFYVPGHLEAGGVDNRLRTGGGQVLTEESLALVSDNQMGKTGFGTAVVSGDLDNDGHQDLIVGVPGSPGAPVLGRVHVLFGSSAGITAAGALSVPLPPHAHTGDRFGASLAVSSRQDPFDPDHPQDEVLDLWVGAPLHNVAGKSEAGAVFRYSLTSPGKKLTYLERLTQDRRLVPGTAEPGDHFGAVLAGGGRNGVVVGVPDEDIGRAKNAGTVQLIRTSETSDALIRGQGRSQNSAGVHGTAETGDRFGAALSIRGQAVGVPGEDIGRHKNAGAVQTFGYTDPGGGSPDYVPLRAFSQDSPGVPGTVESGDRFGSALSQGVFACQDRWTASVGAPGEDIGAIRDAGSITLLPLRAGGRGSCGAQAFSQGHGLPGKAEAGDRVGAAMGVLKGDLADSEDRYDRVLTGVPGEDIGQFTDAGRVIITTGKAATSVGHQRGDLTGMKFGSVLSTFTR